MLKKRYNKEAYYAKYKKNNGYLITFEGIDGSGKTTQAELLYSHLRESGYHSNLFREPGGTAVGEKIRSILLDPSLSEMTPLTELFLYLAARVQITSQLILPALEKGDIVIMDRYSDSTVAYQGFARDIGVDAVHRLNEIATSGISPDLTFIVDCEPGAALSRLSKKPDRLESEGIPFMNRVREGFLNLCKSGNKRYVLIDGAKSIETVKMLILEKVKSRLNLH